MNKGSFTAGFQQHGNFQSNPNTSYCQQTTSNGGTLGAQTTHIGAPFQFTIQHPSTRHPLPSQCLGTNQQLSQHPGTNRQFPQHPGTNPYFAQQPTTTHFPANHLGTNQYPTQYAGNSQCATPYPGQHQFREASHHSGASKIPRPPFFPGKPPFCGTPRYSGNNQAFPETTRFCPPQFQRITTQWKDETQYTSENACQSPVANQYNFQFTTDSTSLNAQTKASNVFQFSEPRQKPVFDNSHSLRQDTQKARHSEALKRANKEQITERKMSDEVQRRPAEKDRITNLFRIQHLILSYVKVRNLGVLCQDFKTPVFGDFPQGNEVEKGIMRNLSHFLKEEIKKLKFVGMEERGNLTFGKCVEDPILRASFPVIESTITRLENKKNGLANEKNQIEILEKEAKAFSDEFKIKQAEAKTLQSEVEAEKARLEKLSDRQKTERKNNEAVRLQFGQEMDVINKIHIQGFHESLRDLQEKISKETKQSYQKKEELQNMKEQNDSLRLRISETMIKSEN